MLRPAPIARTTVTGIPCAEAPAPAAHGTLHVVFPPELRQVFPLGAQEVAVGRDPGAGGLLLEHGTISRRHAVLTFLPAARTHALRDLGSRNGSHADGADAAGAPRPLAHGSVIRLGGVLLVYEREEAPPADAAEVSRQAVPGEALAIGRLRAGLARAAPDPAAVLVIGETGTGKERIARELHRLSGRPGKLVTLNCAALSAPIVESQLFGHVKGAFTGASEAQPGLFREAHGGTLFLDEIGDLPPELQPKLLRVLQEREVLPVGATRPVAVDVRVVAATHRDLARACRDGAFREDLYARLCLWELRVPPLRERRVDLLAWIDRLWEGWAGRRGGASAPRFDVHAAEALLGAAWPLNLRGIERLVHELGAVDGTGATIARPALPAWLAAPDGATGAGPAPAAVPPAPARAERERVPTREEFTRAFEELGGSVHALARRFARDRRQIYRWLEAHGLADRRPRAAPT